MERLNHYFEANEFKNKGKQRAIFLANVGAQTYKLMRNLVMPELPSDKTYDELLSECKSTTNPNRFNTRTQQSGESISIFLAELRNISEDCEFGASLDEMLRDRLVCGTNNERIKKRLLAESKLSLKKATDIALAMEMAEKDILDLHKSLLAAKTESNSDVNKLQVKPQSHREPNTSDNRECYRCGGRHDSDTCRFKDAKCFTLVQNQEEKREARGETGNPPHPRRGGKRTRS